jgi:hypothetical protein
VNETVDPVTLALTGVLPFGVIAGALLAYPLSRLLLRVYHRSVARSMAQHGGAAPNPVPAAPAPAGRPESALQLVDSTGSAHSPLVNAPWSVALAYAAAGSAFALAMTAAWLVATKDASLPATKLLLLFWTYLWPAVLTVNLVAGLRRHHWTFIGIYFAVYALLTGVALARNPAMGWHELPLYWLLINGPPSLLLAAFLARRIRAVGPMVLAFMVIAVTGSQVPATVLSHNDGLLRWVAEVGTAAGLNASVIFWGLMLAGLLAFALAGWLVLQWVGQRYRRKRLSDQMLTIDALWLVFGLVHSIGLVFEGWYWILTGFAAFAAFLAVRSAGFAMLRRSAKQRPRRLLLLRVFALGPRSERLFDLLQKHWLRAGDIVMIAGPDLVTSTVEPHEFLEFLASGVSRQFVKDRADLARRLEGMDTAADPDLRYRVNEFFCHADTWQMTMRELAERSDAVLMDLRSFSSSNQGCLFEVGELLKAVDLRRVVFVIDATTDRRFLEAAMASLWESLPADSPNRRQTQPAARLLDLGAGSGQPALPGLFSALAPIGL